MTTQILHPRTEKAGSPLPTRPWPQRPRSTNAANLGLLVLALASFAIGTGVFVVAALLGGVAREFSIPIGTAGQMLALYALAYAILSPVLVGATARVGRRRLLVAVLLLFALANLAAALAPTFSWLLASRIAAACFAAICAPVGAATAASLVAPERRGRALSVVMGGVSASWVIGVPAATLISDSFGWRAGFLMVSALAAVAALGVGALLPFVGGPARPGRAGPSRLAILGRPSVVITLAVTVLAMVAAFNVLTYVRALLEGPAGMGSGGVASMLVLFGIAGIAGSVLGGLGADRLGYRSGVLGVLVVLAISLFAFSVLGGLGGALVAPVAATALGGLAVAGFALAPLQQHRLIRVAPEEKEGVLALNEVGSDLGQGLGALMGSVVLEHATLGSVGWAGAAWAGAALVVSLVGWRSSEKGTVGSAL